MGNLTNDMTRLRGEVDALRSDRGALMQELASGAKNLAFSVSAMQADFAAAHAAMAKQARGERGAFVANVIDEVNSLLGEFSKDRNDMARKGRHDRAIFLSDMKRQVTDLCKGTADDLMGARLVWRGESPRKSRPVQLKKEPAVVKPLSPPVALAPKKTVALPEAPAVKAPKVNVPPSVSASKPPFQKKKEKSWLDEKPAKAMTKAKKGRK